MQPVKPAVERLGKYNHVERWAKHLERNKTKSSSHTVPRCISYGLNKETIKEIDDYFIQRTEG